MWVEFVLGSLMLREVFLRVIRFSPLRKKKNYNLQVFDASAYENGNVDNNNNDNEGDNDSGNNSQ